MSATLQAGGARCAVYYAPPVSHPLWRAGCDWLGRDPATATASPPTRSGVADPWRYGFHATLKAPMRLAQGVDESAFVATVARLAAAHRSFEMPPLDVTALADFLALRPVQPPDRQHPLWRLADDCVRALEVCRAPSTVAERARQMKSGLDERLRGNVDRHGYAYVLDDWRFHMTLSDAMAPDDPRRDALRAAARALFAAALAVPLRCDDVCIFVEPAPGEPFVLRHRVPLAAS